MPGHKRAHYAGTYRRRAAAVRAVANADPSTTCWRCGLTLAEAQRSDPGVRWDAGHVNDGEVDGLLLAEHSSCNRAAGAAAGNAKREPRSRRWQ